MGSVTGLAGSSGKAPETPNKMLRALYPNPSARDCFSLRAAVPRERETIQPTSDAKNSKADKARSRATMTTDTCSNKNPKTIGHCQGMVGEWPLLVARPPQQFREQLRTDCTFVAYQQAKTSYYQHDHETLPAKVSIKLGDLLIGSPKFDQFERSSDLLLSPNAMVFADQRWTEGAAIYHDVRFSRMEEKIAIPARTGANSSRPRQEPTGHRDMIKKMRTDYLDEMAIAVKHLTRTSDNDVPDNNEIQLQVHEILREIGVLTMSAVSTCYFECLDALAASSRTRQETWNNLMKCNDM